MRQLVHVNCHNDPAWVQQLLQCADPMTISRLDLHHPRAVHLQCIARMQGLEMLVVVNDWVNDTLDNSTAVDFSGRASTLKLLHVRGERGLPRQLLAGLLRAHGATLRHLELQVGTVLLTEPNVGNLWPSKCNDLHVLLGGCQLVALQRLDILRPADEGSHDVKACRRQLKKLRAKLPNVILACRSC